MEELLKTVAEKTGLPADKAQAAIEAVLEFIKDKLPAPIASQVENLLGGGDDGDEAGDDDGGGMSDLLEKGKGMLGGLLGGDK